MKNVFGIILGLLLPMVGVAADHAHLHEAEAHTHEEAPVHVTAEQRQLLHLRLAQAMPGDVSKRLRLTGEIQLNAEQTAKVMPSLPGFVSQILVTEGVHVAKGQVLAVLTSHKLGAYYSDYQRASEVEQLALAEVQRAERLIVGQAISEKDYLRLKREYADAKIAREHAEALLRSLLLDPMHREYEHQHLEQTAICTNYELRAPLEGTVIVKDLTLGENFPEDNGRALFIISNLKQLWLELQVSPADLPHLKVGQSVEIRAHDAGQRSVGKIIYIAPVIAEATRVGRVRVLVENPDETLRAGQFVTGEIQLAGGVSSVFVPREALQLIDGETVVFVPQGDGFAPKPVVAGKTVQGVTQILSGLHVGETYVAEGAFELKSILLTSGMDPHAGHGH